MSDCVRPINELQASVKRHPTLNESIRIFQ
jgi:hypothetical protein